MLLGDFNALVVKEYVRELARDSWNQKRFYLLQFYAINDLIVVNTIFNHKKPEMFIDVSRRYVLKTN